MRFLPYRLDKPEQPVGGVLHEFVQIHEFEHPKHLQDELVHAGEQIGHPLTVSLRHGDVYVNNAAGPLLRIKSVC